MMELIRVYAWSIPAGVALAIALSQLGAHLATRDRTMQTLCVSQGALLGVLLALGFAEPGEHSDPNAHALPFALSFVFSGATFLLTDRLARTRDVSRNTVFAAVFAVLLASGYLVSALFPALENHMTQVYFGDLATLTTFDAKLTLGIGMIASAGAALLWKALARQSFELATFGEVFLNRVARRERAIFSVFALALVCFSVQLVGFLFTVSALFLPTTLLTFLGRGGLRLHLSFCAVLAGVGSLFGFLLSLQYTRLPTVPSIVLWIAGLGSAVLISSWAMRRINPSSR